MTRISFDVDKFKKFLNDIYEVEPKLFIDNLEVWYYLDFNKIMKKTEAWKIGTKDKIEFILEGRLEEEDNR